jgi:uncharacterized protein YkwD
MTSLHLRRRSVLAAAPALLPWPARAATPSPAVWSAYEARLRARLDDAGGGRFDGAVARALLDLTNAARAVAGRGRLAWHPDLAVAAQAHAADLAARSYVEHLSPEGLDPSHRLSLLARQLVGSASENIAYRRFHKPGAAAEIMQLWRRSAPHWTNLLNPGHTHAGFGVVRKEDRTYAVGLYAAPGGRLAAPLPFRISREAEILAATRGGAFPSYGVADPVDERELRVFAADAETLPPVPRGVYQLRPRRPVKGRLVQVLWGPIFLRI